MRRRLDLAYPALLAVVPILYRHVQNPWPALEDAVAFSAALAAAIVAVQLACYGLLRVVAPRHRADAAHWAALTAAAAVGLFYYAPALSDGIHAFAGAHPLGARAALVGALAFAAAVAWWAARHGRERMLARALPPIGRFAGMTALLLVGWFTAQIAASHVRSASIVRNNRFVRDMARPIPAGGVRTQQRHDIYVLVLDEYPAATVLRELYGIDNTPFLDSLRALGFRTPAEVRSNYSVTLVSVGSFLNMTQLQALGDEIPAGYHDYALGTYLLQHNRAAQFAKGQGYRFVFFPSAWYSPTRYSPGADSVIRGHPGLDIGRAVFRSDLIQSFVPTTLLRPVSRFIGTSQAVRAEMAENTLSGVAAFAARPIGGPPVFAVAHVLMPHEPFIVDAACRPYPRGVDLLNDDPPESPQVRAAFAAELTCLNRRVLQVVRAIRARPGPRPIIVLQGDHGTQGLRQFDADSLALTRAQIQERFSPFGAYDLPDGGAAAMPDTTSVVNVLRTVFRYYNGADLPPLPNAMYFSHWATPYSFTPIDTLTLRPAPRPVSRAR